MIELHLPRDVVIGGGAAESLGERVSGLGVERPLVVSDDFLLVGELDALNRELEIPTLSGAGAEREHFERVVEDMAQAALDSGSPGFNPRPATRDEIVALYHEAW